MPLNMKRPIYVGSEEVTPVYHFSNGNFAAQYPGENFLRQFNRSGRPIDGNIEPAVNNLPVTVEVVTLYPHGTVYVKDTPVQSSSYGVDQLIQVRVTKRGGRIIKKELL